MKKLNIKKFGEIKITIFLAILLGATSTSNGQSSTHSSILAISKANHTLAIVDPVSLKVLARIPIGVDPHELIASSDGKTAYVSIYGGGSLHELNAIDLVAKKPINNF